MDAHAGACWILLLVNDSHAINHALLWARRFRTQLRVGEERPAQITGTINSHPVVAPDWTGVRLRILVELRRAVVGCAAVGSHGFLTEKELSAIGVTVIPS